MDKVRLLPFLVVAFVALVLTSCKKDDDKFANGGTGNTDLEVFVQTSTNQPISGAVVSLYLSAADRNASKNAINGGITGEHGYVYFSELSSSIYYVSVAKNFGAGVQYKSADTGLPIKEKSQTAITVQF